MRLRKTFCILHFTLLRCHLFLAQSHYIQYLRTPELQSLSDNLLPIALLFHYIGFGIFFTLNLAGTVLEVRLAKADTFEKKIVLLGVMRTLGLMSPIASLIILVSGIANMHAIAIGLGNAPSWLVAKIFFFVFAVISGVLFGIASRKRAAIIVAQSQGKAPADADAKLKALNTQIRLFQFVLPLLLLIIVGLAVYGVHGMHE